MRAKATAPDGQGRAGQQVRECRVQDRRLFVCPGRRQGSQQKVQTWKVGSVGSHTGRQDCWDLAWEEGWVEAQGAGSPPHKCRKRSDLARLGSGAGAGALAGRQAGSDHPSTEQTGGARGAQAVRQPGPGADEVSQRGGEADAEPTPPPAPP